MRCASGRATTYCVSNFEVSGTHTYTVGSSAVLVYNTCSGSYTITFKNGMKYHGKGPKSRMEESARRLGKKYGTEIDRSKSDWTPAGSERQAFKQENKRIWSDEGGPDSPDNYNQRNSPGKKYSEQDGD